MLLWAFDKLACSRPQSCYAKTYCSTESPSPCRVSATLPCSPGVSCVPPYTLTPRTCFGAPGRQPRAHASIVVCSLSPWFAVLSPHSIQTGMRIHPLRLLDSLVVGSGPTSVTTIICHTPQLSLFCVTSVDLSYGGRPCLTGLTVLQTLPVPAGLPFQPASQVGRSLHLPAAACGAPVVRGGPPENL